MNYKVKNIDSNRAHSISNPVIWTAAGARHNLRLWRLVRNLIPGGIMSCCLRLSTAYTPIISLALVKAIGKIEITTANVARFVAIPEK